MKHLKHTLCTVPLLLVYQIAYAKLPSFASGGDITGQIEEKGENIVDVVTLLAAVVGVIALGIAAVYIGTGNADKGKHFLVGGLGGIFLAGTIYGIAALVG